MASENAPAPRGRPRKLTVDEVVDGAVDLITSEGYAAFSTRALAARLGVRSSTLYSYFDTAEAIEDAAVDRMLAAIRVPDLTTSENPVEELVQLCVDLRELLIVYPQGLPARTGSLPWIRSVGMVNALLQQLLDLGLSAPRAAAAYEALTGVTMASGATSRREQETPAAEVELLLADVAPNDTEALRQLGDWAVAPADDRFRGTVRELVEWLLPMLVRR